MKKNFLILTAIIFGVGAYAQSGVNKVPGRSSFFAEVGGPGILFSANMDYRFNPSHLGVGARAGIGFVTADEVVTNSNVNADYRTASVITVPVQLNYIFGKANSPHAFEVGAGITVVGKKLDILSFYDDRRASVFGSFSFMYRRQPVEGGFSWRIGFTPLLADGFIQPLGALSFGYNF